MLRIHFNNGASLRLALPRPYNKQAIVELAEAFVRYEGTLPEADQTPFTAEIQTALAAVQPALDQASDQEVSRKAASEALKRTEQAAKVTVRQLRSLLTGHFSGTPERAQAWGFIVRQTGRSAGQLLMPQTRAEIVSCLNAYIDTELARPEAERFTQPPLADVAALRDSLVQQQQNRNEAHQLRLQENGRIETLTHDIYENLRLALSYLVLVTFKGEPDRTLAQWGFSVVARTPRPPREPEPVSETEIPEPA